MKIAISATRGTLDAAVDFQFAHASYFLIVDGNTLEYEVIQNPNKMVVGGAEILSAQLIIEKGVETVLTGNCGSDALRVLKAADIKIYENMEGSARQVIETYIANQVKLTQEVTDLMHFGNINI